MRNWMACIFCLITPLFATNINLDGTGGLILNNDAASVAALMATNGGVPTTTTAVTFGAPTPPLP